MTDLTGRVVVVTGGNGGLGLGLATGVAGGQQVRGRRDRADPGGRVGPSPGAGQHPDPRLDAHRDERRVAGERALHGGHHGPYVIVSGAVTAVRPGEGEALVDCDVWADRGDGVRVISGKATVAFNSPRSAS